MAMEARCEEAQSGIPGRDGFRSGRHLRRPCRHSGNQTLPFLATLLVRRTPTPVKSVAKLAAVLVVLIGGLELGLRVTGSILTQRAMADLARQAGDGPIVLAIGESTTAGLDVDPGDSYPRQLQRMLRKHYSNPSIRVVAPYAMGQNSSQQLNRLPGYLEALEPELVLLMCGVNNPWSFVESNIIDFIDDSDPVARRIRLRKLLDRSRVVKLARLGLIDLSYALEDLRGGAERERWPPPSWLIDWSGQQREAFLALWRSDVTAMIASIRDAGGEALLMTYPSYEFPPVSEFEALAAETGAPLVRVDEAFRKALRRRQTSELFLEDGYHPTARGYGLLAHQVYLYITTHDSLDLD